MGRTEAFPQQPQSQLVGVLVGLLLPLSVFIVYYPVGKSQFIQGDDNFYVTANPHVQAGLTFQSIAWAFASTTMGNWHPLTMLSLQLDCELFGKGPQLKASGFHLTNLFLHAAAAWLLFFVFQRMTGSVWKSVWVAALFAFHPLHVESVAWVAERKDVLSALFFALTLLAYVWYTQAPSWPRFVCVAVSMSLGLLAKPMLVTLPCVLLLLDYWPLRRLQIADGRSQIENGQFATCNLRSAIVEKLPLFALSGIFSVLTLWAQHQGHALRTLEERPFPLRLENAVVAYTVYLGKTVWPVDLVPFYPLPENGFPAWQVAGASCLLLAITALAWRERSRRPFLAVGWLWYLGMLVPVIGFVQVGDQAWADRYTYLPLVGIFLLLGWGVNELLADWRLHRWALTLLGSSTIVLCVVLTRIQIGYWHDDVALWQHTLQITPRNDFAHNNLGTYLGQHGRLNEAMDHFTQALALNPRNDAARVNLAKGFLAQGNQAEADQRLVEALHVNPQNEPAHLLLAQMRFRQGRFDEAMSLLQAALRVNPENADTRFYLGQVFRAKGRLEDAAEQFTEGVRLAPESAAGHYLLGSVLLQLGRWQEATTSLARAVDLKPKEPTYRCDLGLALYELGEREGALAQYWSASELQPDWPDQLNVLAWSLLTGKEAKLDQRSRALGAAEEICQATHFQNPQFLDTLAAAYAENGRFQEAVQTARKALDLATASKQHELIQQIQVRKQIYERGRSLRDVEGGLPQR